VSPGTLIDALLAGGLLWLAVQIVSGRTLFRSIVMFVVFGLVMAVAWARLRAPDLALAEAAIGAGITGAMLLVTYRRLLESDPGKAARRYLRPLPLALPLGLLAGLLVFALGYALLNLPATEFATAGDEALRLLPATPVENPVTAVLLLFRGYDTLLEMAVLFAAWLGLRMVQPGDGDAPVHLPAEIPLLQALLSAAIPSAVLVGGYLLHAGGQAPGGAFQAGAVLAAAGVLLGLSGRLLPAEQPGWLLRSGLLLGLLSFTLIGLGMPLTGAAAFALPGYWAVYLIEGALTVSIALTLLLLFLGAAGVRHGRR